MTPERLRKARELFEAAAGESGAAREAVLTRGSDGDVQLRADVERMIEADGSSNPVLDRPLYEAAPRQSLAPGSRVGPYRILREIGSGGMGTVYVAERDAAAGWVALKVLRWALPELSRRFAQEQAILGSLEHPNVARLLETGSTPDERPYFAMEYVEGEPLDRYCERRGLGVEERLKLFRQVCAAVRYLHQNLVVHRDLKPANILVTSGGVVKLVDFGIAKLVESSGRPAETSAGLMTPEYASPEQVRGSAVSTLTDVYALGILLYQLLAGVNPFAVRGQPLHETLRRICEEEPARPSAVGARKIRAELDNIALHALNKEPARRYASVEQFDDDVRRYLAGLPVLAHGDSLIYQGRKFMSRHKGGVAAAAVMLLLLCGGIVSTSYEAGVARRERARAEAHAREAERARAAAETERNKAEQQAAAAERERATAERRLTELRKLADGMVRIYSSTSDTGRPEDAAPLIAAGARDSVLALLGEGVPGLDGLLERTSIAARSYQLAGDPTWHVPPGWSAHETVPREYRVGVDRTVVHSGKSSLFLRSLIAAPKGTVSVGQAFASGAYRGKRVRVSAFLRTERLSGGAHLWLDERAAGEPVRGTMPWKRFDVVIDVPGQASAVSFYVSMNGAGTVWADDFHFEQVNTSAPVTPNPESRAPRNMDFTESR